MTDFESKLRSWSKPSSNSEELRFSNAERMVKDAVKGSEKLKDFEIEIFQQGSYANRTNVKLESDIDICICLKNVFYSKLPEGKSQSDFNIIDSNYSFIEYKNDIRQALIDKFKKENVKPENKCIKILDNSYHGSIDVVPCMEYRLYYFNGTFESGIKFITDGGETIVDWPKQHIRNAIYKNSQTKQRYKFFTRIIKKIKLTLSQEGCYISNIISSYIIECLLYNVRNDYFISSDQYGVILKNIIVNLYNDITSFKVTREYSEVSHFGNLFEIMSNADVESIKQFIILIWNYFKLNEISS